MNNSEMLQMILDKLDSMDSNQHNMNDQDNKLSSMESKLNTISENVKATNAALAKLIDLTKRVDIAYFSKEKNNFDQD